MDYLSSLFDGGLTTGQVAGAIAAGIFIVKILLSLIWPLILVGLLEETETAVTWSVVARIIYNSWWPRVARTDATATEGVRRTVNIISWSIALSSFLVSISAIITPLGLYESIGPEKAPTPVPFRYVKDTSPFGSGTLPRSSLGFSRICRDGLAACPNSDNHNVTSGFFKNGTGYAMAPGGYDTRITKNLFDFLGSGATQFTSTVSSVFDIQWRIYGNSQSQNSTDFLYIPSDYYDNGSTYLVGSYRPLTSLILDESWKVIEGLIVDLKSGGIGFRNHTVPFTGSPYGGTWSEDILFIEPVTECVDLNITVDYTLGSIVSGSGTILNPAIIDNGGFFAANKTSPSYNHSDDQVDPQLAYRAYEGAWLTNALTMALYNITNPGSEQWKFPFSYLNSHFGAEYKLPSSVFTGEAASFLFSADAINTDGFSTWLYGAINSGVPDNSTVNVPPNPFQINSTSYDNIVPLCSGTYFSDQAPGIQVVGGACGLLFGAPHRKDNSSSVLLQEGTNWTTPVYSCASATRALIKTVNFSFNNLTGTAPGQSLEGLNITAINPKLYGSPSEYPLWAAEYGNRDEWSLGSLRPLWGLVADEDARFENLAYRRAPQLWLSGDSSDDGFNFYSPGQNLPAVDFPTGALACSYDVKGSTSSSTCSSAVGDYSGTENVQLYNLWRQLSSTATESARILNLIWTDMAANAVVGTKGWIPSPPQTDLAPSQSGQAKRADVSDFSSGDISSAEAMVPINLLSRSLKYHIPYATPAFLVLGIVLLTLLAGLSLTCLRRTSPRAVKRHIVSLSPGRIMTALLENDSNAPGVGKANDGNQMTMSTRRWLKQHGNMRINLSNGIPRADPQLLNDGNDEALNPMLGAEVTATGTSFALSDVTARDQSVSSAGFPPGLTTK